MQSKRTILLVAVTLTCFQLASGFAFCQTRHSRTTPAPAQPQKQSPAPTQKRAAIINLRKNDSVMGDFIRADARSVLIEVDGQPRSFNTEDVVSVVFSMQAVNTQTTPKGTTKNDTALVALKALRKLSTAVDIGINFLFYKNLLLEVKTEVDESLATMPEGELKQEISLAVEAYVDAGYAWNILLNGAGDWNGVRFADQLKGKYKMDKKDLAVLGFGLSSRNDQKEIGKVLNYIWSQANVYLAQASALANQ